MSTVFPGIPPPRPDVQSLTQTALAMKSSIEILTGATKNAAVTYSNMDKVTYNIDAYIQQQGALVEQLSTIVTDVSGTTAALQTEVDAQGVQVTTNTTAISSINGELTGKWGVSIDIDNKVTGVELIATGSGISSFDVRADKFNVWATGLSNTPVFSVSTIGGVASVTINGNYLGDLSTPTNAVANNAITNSAGATGGGSSGTVSITVRPGARLLALAEYDGGDVSLLAGGSLTLNTSGGVTGVNIPNVTSGSFHIYYGAAAMQVFTSSGGGTINATASVNTGTGNTAVYLQELAK